MTLPYAAGISVNLGRIGSVTEIAQGVFRRKQKNIAVLNSNTFTSSPEQENF